MTGSSNDGAMATNFTLSRLIEALKRYLCFGCHVRVDDLGRGVNRKM